VYVRDRSNVCRVYGSSSFGEKGFCSTLCKMILLSLAIKRFHIKRSNVKFRKGFR